MSFIVNSSPGAGFRFEPSATFPDAKGALSHAMGLATRGMRLIKIKNTETGEILDEKGAASELVSCRGRTVIVIEDERDTLTPADYIAAGVAAPNWAGEPTPSLETWRLWRAAQDQALAHKRARAKAPGVKTPA